MFDFFLLNKMYIHAIPLVFHFTKPKVKEKRLIWTQEETAPDEDSSG